MTDVHHLAPALPVIDLGEISAFLSRCAPDELASLDEALLKGLTASGAELMGRIRYLQAEVQHARR